MATLVPGVLLKFLDAMKKGKKPTGKLFQVTDIVPADLDEKTLLPQHGFHLKVSDSTHSIYGSLPLEQDDLVLSNKIQLGQFIHIDQLEPGSPVPLLRGVKPISGRHPLVGTPELITGLSDTSEKALLGKGKRVWSTKVEQAGKPIPSVWKTVSMKKMGRSSHSSLPLIKATVENSNTETDCSTLSDEIVYAKKKSLIMSGKCSSILVDSNAKFKRSRRAGDQRQPWIAESSSNLENKILKRKARGTPGSTSPSYKHRRQLSSSSSSDGQKASSPPRRRLCSSASSHDQNARSSTIMPSEPKASRTGSNKQLLSLPGNLSSLGKEVVHQREATQRIAVEVLSDLSASETIVGVLKRFSELCSIARPDEPAETFDQFLDVHRQISQAVIDMEVALTTASTTVLSKDDGSSRMGGTDYVATEAADNNDVLKRSLSAKEPQVCRKLIKKSKTGTLIRSILHKKATNGKNPSTSERDCMSRQSCLRNLIKLGKQIETESANWFMEFLEKSLEVGTKGSRVTSEHRGRKGDFCDQSLILDILNWVGMEQTDPSKRPIHPKAASITRKLRIKARKPQAPCDFVSPVALHLLGN